MKKLILFTLLFSLTACSTTTIKARNKEATEDMKIMDHDLKKAEETI